MADEKISGMGVAVLAGTEMVEVVQGGVNKRTTTQAIADLAPAAGIQSVVAGTNVTVDATDPANPIVNASGGAVPDASETVKGIIEIAIQAETNTGTDDVRALTPLKLANYTGVTNKQLLINSATALTDAASMDLTAIKHTLTTSSATRTFTISYTGDDVSVKVILNALGSVFTFPAGALCINSDGSASGNNTCSLSGASGDNYVFAIKHWGSSVYTVVCKNTLQ